jgi:hypothetical protein
LKIQRGTGTVQAQLVQLLTEGTASPNPRWLIHYVGNSKDDEVYEHSFLAKVGMNNEDSTTCQSVEQNILDDDSPGIFDQQNSKKKKSDNINDVDPVVNSDSSFGLKGATKTNKASSNSSRSSNKNSALSTATRDVRSRRRGQPLPDKELYEEKQEESARSDDRLSQNTGEINALATQQQRKRKLTGAAKMSVETKRERESKTAKSLTNTSSLSATTKPQQHPKEEEECVKIKFLTGTLYLYRGKRRRAEFVRRV